VLIVAVEKTEWEVEEDFSGDHGCRESKERDGNSIYDEQDLRYFNKDPR